MGSMLSVKDHMCHLKLCLDPEGQQGKEAQVRFDVFKGVLEISTFTSHCQGVLTGSLGYRFN